MKTKYLLYFALITLAVFSASAAASDYTLGVFGNANEDKTINMQDVTYTELIILEYQDATELADAKYDGEIDILDVTQIELVILGTEKEITLIDGADRIVTVEKPVERIVPKSGSGAEAVSLLGAWDRVVGRQTQMTNELLFPGVSDLPVTSGTYYEIYHETVFELEPDIFLTEALVASRLEDDIATLEPEITVVALNFNDPSTMVESIRKLKYILNTKEEGDEFIAFYEDVMNDITEKTAGLSEDEKPRVFIKCPGWTPEAISTFTDEMPAAKYQMEIAGGINIAADLPGTGFVSEVDQEWLVEQNPDIIVAKIWEVYNPDVLGYDVDDDSAAIAVREEIMEMDLFAGSNAVVDGKVYLYEVDVQNTPRFVVGVAYFAKWFHPELFGDDFNPKEIHQQYLTDFLGVDYDLDEQGVFMYPEP